VARYRIVFTPSAERSFLALTPDVRARLDTRLLALRDQPRPPGIKALAGVKGVYRLRVGDYRLLYEVCDVEVVVLVLAIGHRREVYRRRR
jgi:mRNA interferase RelE/StbE